MIRTAVIQPANTITPPADVFEL